MFNKKSKSKKETENIEADSQLEEGVPMPYIFVMPEVFLSAASQTIKFKNKKKEKKQKVKKIKRVKRSAVPKKGRLIHPAVIVVAVFMFLAIGAGAVYLYISELPVKESIKVVVEKITPEFPSPPEKVVELPPEPVNLPDDPVVVVPDPIKLPTKIVTLASYSSTPDTDVDYLTDYEENLYGTSINNKDEDGDTFTDGLEMIKLYSPKNGGQSRLVDSGLVNVFNNPDQGYSVYYPFSWKIRFLEQDKTSISFESNTVEFVQILVTPDIDEENIVDWARKQFPEVDTSKLERVAVGDYHGIKSPRGLTVNFVSNNNLYSIVYQISTLRELNFKATFEMMVNSFELHTRSGGDSGNIATDWVKYGNEDLGIDFNYPEFLEIDDSQEGYLSFKTFDFQFLKNNKKLDLNTWFEESYNKEENRDCTLRDSELKIGNLKTVLIDISLLDTDVSSTCEDAGYYAISTGKTRVIKLNVGPDAVREMAQIISTIRIKEALFTLEEPSIVEESVTSSTPLPPSFLVEDAQTSSLPLESILDNIF